MDDKVVRSNGASLAQVPEFEFPFPGSLLSTFLVFWHKPLPSFFEPFLAASRFCSTLHPARYVYQKLGSSPHTTKITEHLDK